MSEERRIRRYLLRRSKKGKLHQGYSCSYYVDNKGTEYPYKWEAMLSSFCNIVTGCLKNGFPIAVPRLWYAAWAFYPFFFIRKNLKVENPIPILNHERIHVRQQRDIHFTISLPLLVLCCILELLGVFNPLPILCIVPFIPTLVYGIEMLRSWWCLWKRREQSITFKKVRENTCFEREAVSRSTNEDYLFVRKFWAVLAYTGLRYFQNYGIK